MSTTAQLEAAAAVVVRVEPITPARTLRGPFDYSLPDELRGDMEVGSMLVVPFGRRRLLGVVTGFGITSEVPDGKLLPPLRALELGLPTELVELARWVAREYCSTFARALSLVLPPDASRRLGGRRRAPARPPHHVAVGSPSPHEPQLSDEQAQALAPLLDALRAQRHEQRLLHGVTGSGKTEVYVQAARAALQGDRSAIVLVPEIALTPQIVARFLERFGDTVAVLHSRLTPAQRYAEWRRLREGEARVCVGPRSAVFAPVRDLGLIVVDEEHDASYKHEGDPRYDAREVAAERARASGALLILGSATPRPETIVRTPVSVLARRVDGRPLPPVAILDMCGEPPGLHPRTAGALAQVREQGGKAIVLLNRRGWSNFLSCRACGEVWSCPECDVALVLHRSAGIIACHHCGHREHVPDACERCGSTSVARHGSGTERLQHELAAVFDDGGFPVFRLDADALGGGPASGTANPARDAERSREEGVAGILSAFQRATSGVLIGTQMVAKGHDFPDVRLGVVLDADATLRFPDFRAEERTFSLIAQLAGRVGRGGQGGVLVQTLAPQARAIVHAAAHDSAGFVAGELERRRALSYPPYSKLVRIICSADGADRALAASQELRAELDVALAAGEATVLGPATLFRLRGRERRVLIVKTRDRPAAASAIGVAVHRAAGARAHAGVSFSVDVEPQ